MPFQENVSNFVQYAVLGHKDGVLLVFSLFNVTFFECRFHFRSFVVMVQLRTNIWRCLKAEIVVEFKRGWNTGTPLCVCVAVTPDSSCWETPRDVQEAADLMFVFLRDEYVPSNVCFFPFAKNVFVKHLCILRSTYCWAHLWRKSRQGQGLLHCLFSIGTKALWTWLLCQISK